MGFLVSLAIHVLIAVSLLFFADNQNDKPEELTVELISSPTSRSSRNMQASQASTVGLSQKKRVLRVVVSPELLEPFENTGSKEKNDTALGEGESKQATELFIGESDVDSILKGRPPMSAMEKYLVEVRNQISQFQKYPSPSRAFREEGIVKIRLTINRIGSLIKIELVEPSPYKRLNDAAMRAATSAAPFAAFPAEIDFDSWKISLPVRFVLVKN